MKTIGRKKKSCFTVTFQDKKGLEGWDFFFQLQCKFFADIMLHRHTFCIYKGQRKVKSANFVLSMSNHHFLLVFQIFFFFKVYSCGILDSISQVTVNTIFFCLTTIHLSKTCFTILSHYSFCCSIYPQNTWMPSTNLTRICARN